MLEQSLTGRTYTRERMRLWRGEKVGVERARAIEVPLGFW